MKMTELMIKIITLGSLLMYCRLVARTKRSIHRTCNLSNLSWRQGKAEPFTRCKGCWMANHFPHTQTAQFLD